MVFSVTANCFCTQNSHGERNGSVVKNTCYSSRGLRLTTIGNSSSREFNRLRHQSQAWYTYTHVSKTFRHMKY